MLLWDGSCMVHEIFSLEKLVKLKIQYPQAKIIAHPECEENILKHADFIVLKTDNQGVTYKQHRQQQSCSNATCHLGN